MSADEDSTAVVIDNGSAMVKAGLAGEDAPRMVFPSLIGRPKRNVDKSSIGNRDFFVGEEAQIHRGLLTLTYPIENGVVTNWDDMERVWHHTFYNELKVEPENLPVLMAEAPLNPTSNREKMMEVMFEKFQVPGFYVSIQAVLSMYAGGRVSAIMLDSGDGLSHVLPIYEGRALVNTIRRVNFAGSAMTTYLTRLLNERGNCFTTSAEREIVRDIKEKHCYVSEDYDAEMTSSLSCPSSVEKEYELPDGRIIEIGNERFRVPECLFQPDLLSIDCEGLHESVVRCLQHCDIDTRADLYCNIVLSGGNTMFPGLPERLKSEIKKISPQKLVKTNVVAYPCRKYHVWIGGSILASLTRFNDMYIKKQEYEEEGPRIVHRKCF